MPFRHFLFAPMIHRGADPVARLFLFDRAPIRGSVLFHSTAARGLQLYRMHVSEAPYTVVPMAHTWIQCGTARDYDEAVSSPVTVESMTSLCGAVYTEGYVFDSGGDAFVDLYLRCSVMSPTSLYFHYRLNVVDYCLWMEATQYDYMGLIDRPDWAWSDGVQL